LTLPLLILAALTSPEQRAVAYLVQEVPAWPQQNHCFSCHNNGDGARALYQARRRGFTVPSPALTPTTEWLSHPDRWDSLPGDAVFSDKRLARIQFAVALAEAQLGDPQPLREAAQSLVRLQHADGYWPLDGGDVLGSPVTYGIPLATALATRTLQTAGTSSDAVERAKRWLQSLRLSTTLDAAAVLLTVERPDARQFLLQGQGTTGGWGPYPRSPAEPFDTAIVILALAPLDRPALERARQYLIRTQQPDGSWPETTRPSGAQSYAQRISTTAWATQALLATSPQTPR
jgi:hypothetical protein